MKLLNVEFVTSAAAGGSNTGIPRDGLLQVAFAGRSNVGKSTLLNALCRRSIARTSAAPGKTRLANVYRVTAEGGSAGPGRWSCYFVDLPGYGYARGGSDAARELASVAEAYFAAVPNTEPRTPKPESRQRIAFQLVDSRHPGLESDVQAAAWFTSSGIVRHVVATKVDKLTRAERTRNLRELERIFGTAVLPVAAERGEGLDELWRVIASLAREKAPETPR